MDATQEMIALGLSNVAGAFVSSIPISGSFTRSAINNTSGVKTPFGGFFTGEACFSIIKISPDGELAKLRPSVVLVPRDVDEFR